MANLHSRGHDLSFTLDGVEYGFQLYWEGKDPPLTVASQETAESTASFLKRDLPRIWHDWSGGAFHSLSPQNAGPLVYGSLGQFGTAPPVYAYARKMRMRDPAVATPAGLAVEPLVYGSAARTSTIGLRSIPKCGFNYNGSVYIVCANGDVLKSPNGTEDLHLVTNLVASNALNVWDETGSGSKTAARTTYAGAFDPARVVQYNGGFYLVSNDVTKPFLYFDGADENGAASDASWFKSSAAGGVADVAYWVKNNRGADYFVFKSGRGTIKYTNANPLQAASHSADYEIGDIDGTGATHPITNVLSTGRVVLVAKEDGVYVFDELGRSANLTPQFRNVVGSGNGAVGMVFGEYAYFQFFEGTYRINLNDRTIQDVGGWVTPGLGLPNRTPINGPIIAFSQDRDWLAAVVEANGSSWLGYGRERGEGDPPVGPMIWHFSEYDHAGTMAFVHRGTVTSATEPARMWLGGYDADQNPFLVYQYLTRTSTALGDVESGAPTRFAEECELYFPADPIGDANALKYVLASNMQAGGLSMPAGSFDHQVRFAEGAAWTSLGICTDPEAWVGLPTEGMAGGYQFEQRLVGNAPSDDPPRLYALRARFAVIPDAVGVRRYRLVLGDRADRRSLPRQWAILQALTRAGKLRGHDRVLGDRLVCRVEQGHKATPIAWSADGRAASFAVEIEVTVYAQGQSAIRFDDPLVAVLDAGSRLT